MSAPAFTPGPWSVSTRTREHRPEALVHVGAYGVGGGPGNALAIVYLGGPGAASADEAGIMANAHLIAAAPALYEACEASLAELECCSNMPACNDEDEPMPHGERCSQCLAHEKVAAAIRAARGEL